MNFIDFAKLLKDDEELLKKFQTCTKLEDAYAVATEAGLSISFEQFSEYMNKIANVSVELSDEDVEAIAAGCGGNETAVLVTFKVLEGITSLTCV
ncbi:MAG: Nif11-like leader peptide family RiPP precursor [Eubacteriales bacterium]|nr:Nif11-like leader peptide family RiPP precursor [Eubacteriales bacterium]